jgi:hypothetical protein
MVVRVGSTRLWLDRLLAQAGEPELRRAAVPAMSMPLSPSPCWSFAA